MRIVSNIDILVRTGATIAGERGEKYTECFTLSCT